MERLAFGGMTATPPRWRMKSADRVAVVSLVHNGVSARLEVSLKQGFGLVKVGDIGPGKNESKGATQGVAGHVNFCRYAGAGPSHGLGDLAADGV